ncbi:MAG: GrpB family protein [Anaerolineae bacterium]|nr:GrpB family protein [Anaerolineae bacterium]
MAQFDPNESFDLSEYNPEWPALFEQESARIAEAMGDEAVEIEHIGSTSVPGLRAKPILDILLVVEEFASVEHYQHLLEPLGYRHHFHEDEADRKFFWKGVPRTHHLHIAEYATWEHQRHIIFRDYLRSHPEIAKLYEESKRQLAIEFHANRPAYTKGKTAFIKSIVMRAFEEIRDPSLRRLISTAEEGESEP